MVIVVVVPAAYTDMADAESQAGEALFLPLIPKYCELDENDDNELPSIEDKHKWSATWATIQYS